jgi:hypothetical protein
MAWRNLDIDQLMVAALLTRDNDAQHDWPGPRESGVSGRTVTAGAPVQRSSAAVEYLRGSRSSLTGRFARREDEPRALGPFDDDEYRRLIAGAPPATSADRVGGHPSTGPTDHGP